MIHWNGIIHKATKFCNNPFCNNTVTIVWSNMYSQNSTLALYLTNILKCISLIFKFPCCSILLLHLIVPLFQKGYKKHCRQWKIQIKMPFFVALSTSNYTNWKAHTWALLFFLLWVCTDTRVCIQDRPRPDSRQIYHPAPRSPPESGLSRP